MLLKKLFLNFYLGCAQLLSNRRGYGKKYKVINSTVNKIETVLKSDTANVWAGKMFLHPNDGLRLSIRGIYDKYGTIIIKRNVKKNDVVIDLGAHIGYYTLMMAKLVGESGKVFAFEPEPRNLVLLKKNIKVNCYNNITVVPKAVSNINGRCELYVGQESFGANRIYKPRKTNTQQFQMIKSETIKLDDYFTEKKMLDKISFVKMDIEGAEMLALEGMKKILRLNDDLKIFTEINRNALEDSGSNFESILDLLKCNNFEFFVIDEKEELSVIESEHFRKMLDENLTVNILCKKSKKQ